MDELKKFIDSYVDLIFKFGLIAVILSTLFLFTNFTTEFYDTPKFIILLIFTGLILIMTALRFTLLNKVVLVRTPLDIPLLILLAVSIVSTVVSPSQYVSLLGNQLKIHTSLISTIVYVFFYFLLVNNLKNIKTIKFVLYITTLAGILLSAISLITFLGVTVLPPPWTHGINFTTTGSSFSTTAILALLVPIVTSQILIGNFTMQIVNSLILCVFGVTIALTGTWSTWIAGILGFGLTLLTNRSINWSKFEHIKPTILIGLSIPIIVVALITSISYIPNLGGYKNPINTQAKNFPKDQQLSFPISWKIAVSAFRDMPFWGTGPSTFLFNFTAYKPIEYNSTSNWNLRFDSAFNEYLNILATLGGVGILALISMTALFISASGKTLLSKISDSNENFAKGLAVSGLIFFILIALHSSSMPLWVLGLILIASFMILNLPNRNPTNTSNKELLSRIISFSPTAST